MEVVCITVVLLYVCDCGLVLASHQGSFMLQSTTPPFNGNTHSRGQMPCGLELHCNKINVHCHMHVFSSCLCCGLLHLYSFLWLLWVYFVNYCFWRFLQLFATCQFFLTFRAILWLLKFFVTFGVILWFLDFFYNLAVFETFAYFVDFFLSDILHIYYFWLPVCVLVVVIVVVVVVVVCVCR